MDPFAALRAAELDLTVGPVLMSDSRIHAVSTDHELAQRSTVSVEMLADFPNGTVPQLPDYFEDACLPFQSPRGRVIERAHCCGSTGGFAGLVRSRVMVEVYRRLDTHGCGPRHIVCVSRWRVRPRGSGENPTEWRKS